MSARSCARFAAVHLLTSTTDIDTDFYTQETFVEGSAFSTAISDEGTNNEDRNNNQAAPVVRFDVTQGKDDKDIVEILLEE